MTRFIKSSVSALALSALVMGGVVSSVITISASPALSAGKSSDKSGGRSSNRGGNRGDNGRGATASSLGALNAAHANENAFLNAAEGSRVGLIALYRTAVQATFDAEADRIAAEDALAVFTATCGEGGTGTPEECDALLIAATEEAQLAAEEGVVVDLYTYETYVAALEATILASTEAADLAAEAESVALEAAANKETDEEVITALWDLLDLVDPSAEE